MENLCNNQDQDSLSDWNMQNTLYNQEQGLEDDQHTQNGYNDETSGFFINQEEDFKLENFELDEKIILDSSFEIKDEIDNWLLDSPIQDDDNTFIPSSHQDPMTMVCHENGENLKISDNLFSETALPLHQISCHENGEDIKNLESLFPETSLPIPQTSIVYCESRENINNHDILFPDTVLTLHQTSVACHENGENIKKHVNLLPEPALPLHQTSIKDGIHNHGGGGGGGTALPLHPTSFNDGIPNHGGGDGNGDDGSSLYTTNSFLKDGYKWSKYGRKERKGINHQRCYYKCTHSTCLAKKTVEMNEDGEIIVIRYREGGHNHLMPNKEQCSPFLYEAYNSSNSDERVTREEIVVLKTKSETDNVEDNFKWRKYGEKVVKGSPNPRTYYQCADKNCYVRRQCERCFKDPEYVIVTYEGKHEHDWPRVKGDRGPGVFIGGVGGEEDRDGDILVTG